MSEQDPEGLDPFHPEVVPGVSLIVLMRIYDVLMATYTNLDPEGANKLYELHAAGKIVGSMPIIDMSPEDLA